MDQATVDRVQGYIDVLQAYLRGEEIQYRDREEFGAVWATYHKPYRFQFGDFDYRIKPLQLEVGKLYRTKGGKKALVVCRNEHGDTFRVAVAGNPSNRDYKADGSFWCGFGTPDEFDIISEWKD